jgi:ribosomal protein S2
MTEWSFTLSTQSETPSETYSYMMFERNNYFKILRLKRVSPSIHLAASFVYETTEGIPIFGTRNDKKNSLSDFLLFESVQY